MPDIGNTSIGASTINSEGEYRLIPITMTEDGTIDSVSAYIAETGSTGSHNFIAVVYSSDGSTKIDESSCRSDITTTAGWVTFTGFAGAALSDATSYMVGLAISGGGSTTTIAYDTGSSGDSKLDWSVTNFPCTSPDSSINPSNETEQLSIYLTYTAAGGSITESIPAGTIELIGVAPSTNTVVPVKPESIPLGTIELIGVAPSTNTVSTTSAESIPVGTLTLTGFAPRRENNYTGVEVITLTGFAPEYSINGLVAASIPVATFELTGFAPGILSAGLRTESIPLGTIELVGVAPVAQVTGGAAEGIPQATLELTGFAPQTQRIGDRFYAVDGNVIHLIGAAPGVNNKNPRAQPVKKGGVPPYRRWKQRRTVLIGGKRYVVWSYTEERYLLEQYLKRLQIEESQEEAPEVRKRPLKLVSRNISLTETRIAKLDQRVEWHRKKLRQEDDLLLSLFG